MAFRAACRLPLIQEEEEKGKESYERNVFKEDRSKVPPGYRRFAGSCGAERPAVSRWAEETRGGFVGVDVFFVISGYLISSIVFSEIADSRFSVVGFYERRIRRIFPALFAMLAVTSVMAAIYLLPGELIDYAKSLLAASLSTSNVYFWQHSGYFDAPTSKPLLHTWSLAVEEQFYIFFPLFLIVVRRFFPQRLRISVVALFSISLVASALEVRHDQQTAFYLPFTRAWELLLGTLLSLGMFPRLSSAWLRNLATLAGMWMIGYSVLFYTQETVFPGLTALVPCVGSALIIGAGEGGSSLMGGLLSWRPVVFIGLISYSLYLWHWPVIIMRNMGILMGIASIGAHNSPQLSSHRFDMLVEIVLSLLLAVLSWRFVERPFRNGRLRVSGRPLFALAATAICVLVGLSSAAIFSGGFRSRFPASALRLMDALDSKEGIRDQRVGTCFITTEYHFEQYNEALCLSQDRNRKNYLLLGDSHSAMLWSALSSSLRDANVMQASTAACAPSLRPTGSQDCAKMMEYIFQKYLPANRVDALYVVGRWEQNDLGALTSVIAWAKRHSVPVTVFGPMPEYDSPLPRLLVYSAAWREPSLVSKHLMASSRAMDELMQNSAENIWHVPYISLYREICAANGCAEYADEAHRIPLMGDTNHLTAMGAAFVVRRLVEKGELQ